ncbi:Similar to S.cerevisiae protein FAA4 (Long chain fatty acyl-CoA synthetase) [Malassezia sympodialis ATCC 42132]|uniref:Similar to S.cerevisiae protein FAA4 (Long chain fatty acyl-CoA synthetase) n=1 Tax=Malassezia sympodialis (strain ATCC 42132) TaxID=1230383 RepID=A0A1M8AAH8_MALS4|nr:Similar to S.cerevisiae protein FAA4 (Long chain fatty acyl-CoA synthetase) [Malassezia sympodialis ATCC 42132]
MKQSMASVAVSEAEGNLGPIRRSVLSPEHLVERPAEGIETMGQVLDYGRKKFGTRKMIATRDLIREHHETKKVKKMVDGEEVEETKTWTYFELTDYHYHTLNEFVDMVDLFANGLNAIGLGHKSRFNIFASTAMDWQVAAQACFRLGMPFCTAYDTLGPEGLQVSLDEPEVEGLFTNAVHLPVLEKVIQDTPHLRAVVYDGEADPKVVEQIKRKLSSRPNSVVKTADEIYELGKTHKVDNYQVKRDDIACIMYTSGSTGKPKGVILTHANLVATVSAISLLLKKYVHPGDSILAYLPLAHILEFVMECWCFMYGIQVGYGRVKTLTSASTRNCVGDMQAFRPTLMVGVPAVWETIRKGILSKVEKAGSVKQRLFSWGMWAKEKSVPGLSQAADKVVFKALREQTGGRLRLALSGGAPISKDTQKFLNNALVLVLQGYGMTESSAMCAILQPEFFKFSCVGSPMPSIEVRLCDVPEAGYYSTNSLPQGEILIRGPSVSQGYFKRPELTKEAISDDGWLRTGDVGQWNADGTISLIDRKKNLVKLAGGEYIALERLESNYKSSSLVSNICLYASSDARQPMAIVFPREENLRMELERAGHSELARRELEDICHEKAVNDLICKDLNRIGRGSGYATMELLQCVVAIPEELPLTAAQKVQRKDVEKKYANEIKKVYPFP